MRNTRFRRCRSISGLIATVALVFGALATGCNSSASDDQKIIKYGYVNWSENVINTMLAKEILEKAGYKVETQAVDVGPLFAGLGSGSLDVFTEAWLPGAHGTQYRRYQSKLTKLGEMYDGKGTSSLAVPKYCKAKTFADLQAQRSEYGGKIIGIDPGANIMADSKEAIKKYGLDYELVTGSEPAMTASLKKAYQAKKCVVVTVWQPLWVWSVYDLRPIEDPKRIFASDTVYSIANKEFVDKFPDAAKFFSAYQLSLEDIDAMMLAAQKGTKPSKVAKDWIARNPDQVKKWVALAKGE